MVSRKSRCGQQVHLYEAEYDPAEEEELPLTATELAAEFDYILSCLNCAYAQLSGGQKPVAAPAADGSRWKETWRDVRDPYYNPQFRDEDARYRL